MAGSIRMTGLSSGLDTDSIVEELMSASYEKQSYYKAQRQQYLTEYKIEAYREVTSKLTDFSSKYLDSLSSTNMKSGSFYRKFTTSATSDLTGNASKAVTITSTSEANAGTHSITIKQVAQQAKITGAKTTGVVKTAAVPVDSANGTVTYAEGSTIEVTIDGKTKDIDVSGTYNDAQDLASQLQEKIKDTFGTGYDETNGKVSVEVSDEGELHFTTINGASKLSIYDENDVMNFTNTSSSLSLTTKMEDLENAFTDTLTYATADGDDSDGADADQIRFKINGKEFSFDKSATLKSIMQEINNDDDINVTLEYNSTTGKFSILSDSTGADEAIEIEDLGGSNFFRAIGIAGTEGKASTSDDSITNYEGSSSQEGLDTLATVDGIEIARSTRTFTVDGITYQANETTAEGDAITVNLDINTEEIYESIKTFIDDYNELIDYMQDLVDEEYDSDYQPLTDDERSEMTEDEIEKWDKKAKTGLLHNDSILESLLSSLRSQFSGTISGMTTTFSDIGIKTGSYTNGGKIILDDEGITDLKSAISNNLDDVVALFTQKSTTYSASSSRSYTYDERTTRKQEEGLMNRFYDTLEDYISTYRDSSNSKGKLLEKAGKEGDTTETTSTLSEQLIDYTEKVSDLLDKVNDKYDRLYDKYASLETSMSSLNSQSSYISSLLGSSS